MAFQLNTGIPLSINQPDYVNTLARSDQARAQRGQEARQLEVQNFLRESGDALYRGDHEALGQYAKYDPQAAFGMRAQQEQLRMQQERLQMARAAGARAAANARMSAQEAAQAKQEYEQMRKLALLRESDPEAFAGALQQPEYTALGVTPDNFDLYLATADGAAGELFGRMQSAQPPAPEYAFDDGQFYDRNNPQAGAQPIPGFVPEERGPLVDMSGASFGPNGAPNEDYIKARNKTYAEQMAEIESQEAAARRALSSLTVMSNSMEQPGFYSGSGSEAVMAAKRLGRGLGLDVEGIDSMEAFNSQAKSAALDVMGGSLGAGFSNADRDFVLDQVPNLSNTPEGNAALIEVQKKLQNRRLEIAERARQYEARNGQIDNGFNTELARWASENPVFNDFEVPSSPGGTSQFSSMSIDELYQNVPTNDGKAAIEWNRRYDELMGE